MSCPSISSEQQLNLVYDHLTLLNTVNGECNSSRICYICSNWYKCHNFNNPKRTLAPAPASWSDWNTIYTKSTDRTNLKWWYWNMGAQRKNSNYTFTIYDEWNRRKFSTNNGHQCARGHHRTMHVHGQFKFSLHLEWIAFNYCIRFVWFIVRFFFFWGSLSDHPICVCAISNWFSWWLYLVLDCAREKKGKRDAIQLLPHDQNNKHSACSHAEQMTKWQIERERESGRCKAHNFPWNNLHIHHKYSS